MYYRFPDSYLYLVDFFTKRIGLTSLNQQMLSEAISLLGDYYNHIEDSSLKLKPNQICTYKLVVVDALLQMTNSIRSFSNRINTAREIFTKYENDESIKFFITWLERASEDNRKVVIEVHKAAAEEIYKILIDLARVENNIGILYSEHLDKALLDLHSYLNESRCGQN